MQEIEVVAERRFTYETSKTKSDRFTKLKYDDEKIINVKSDNLDDEMKDLLLENENDSFDFNFKIYAFEAFKSIRKFEDISPSELKE